MDNAKLTEIVIIAVIAAIVRELVTVIIKQSTTLVTKLKNITIKICKANPTILLITADSFVLISIGISLFAAMSNHKPITGSEAVNIAFTCIMWVYWPRKLRDDFEKYKIEKITKKLCNKSIQSNADNRLGG